MSSETDLRLVRVSPRGRVPIPKPLRETLGIETPDEVLIYEQGERIIVKPIPSLDDLAGIHASDDCKPGDVLERVREMKDRNPDR